MEQLRQQLIGDVPLQRIFDIGLSWLTEMEEGKEEFQRIHMIYKLEAKFREIITDDQRLRIAKEQIEMGGRKELQELVTRYRKIFMANEWDIGRTDIIKHEIKTKGKPINIKPRRQPEHLQSKLDEAIKNLEENRIIRRCNSP